MSDNFIQVDIDDTELKTLLSNLRKKGQDFSPVTESIAEYLHMVTEEVFDNEGSFDGVPWDRLADSTVEAKGHDKKLWGRDSKDESAGKMQESLGSRSDGGKAIVGLNAVSDDGYTYPAVHHFGSNKVPARPFLPFNEDKKLHSEAEEEIIRIVKEFLEEL